VQAAVTALGGKVEAFYYAFGEDDAVTIADLPNKVKARALALTTSGSGAVRVRTTPLLTVEDVYQALEIKTQAVFEGLTPSFVAIRHDCACRYIMRTTVRLFDLKRHQLSSSMIKLGRHSNELAHCEAARCRL
jgi:hypothetical protein